MAMQNIFDNEIFFEGYKEIRNQKVNANNLFEIPALISLLPKLEGKTILDLGCGYGEHCIKFIKQGAQKVVGVDISKKMLEIAERENSNPMITYLNMPMEEINRLSEKFDVVISSLAIHYVEDYAGLVHNVYDLLQEGGTFVFSQEHPLNTCFSGGSRWTKDEKGKKLYVNLANYSLEGERESEWFVEGVKKYHRTFSTILNTLTGAGFTVEKLVEPCPTEEILQEYPKYADLFHKPDFLLVRAGKL